MVVNYELPETPQWLTHRVGRTARNGRSGRAFTFVTDEDGEKWHKLRRLGAPEIPGADTEHLLTTGEIRHVAMPRLAFTPGSPAPRRRGGGFGNPGRRQGNRVEPGAPRPHAEAGGRRRFGRPGGGQRGRPAGPARPAA